ncbi:porin [Acinetobacter sp. C15]|uniref:OprD family porin n=1 Tax=Acinetobacter TaxID=469 RepID=UPI0006610F5B|nr:MULTISPECIES: OprD family porin [Acinetobacter]KOR14979.1 porin [Acinetobacter sp. C15]MBO3640712.1 OprD family porin [Acinetobacter soli]WEH89643.1 OprD family porin [Acinetobacter soli]WEI10754.1 OprD family porin [Acinetobacter soli]
MSKLWMYSAVMLSGSVFASDFIDKSTVELTTRNFYFDRDYQEVSKYPAAKDWTQGFIFKANSGYTEGTIGFGLDVLATAGFKLDASAKYAGTGNLPRDTVTNEPASSYGEIGLTGKAKVSQTELKVGTLRPMNPVLVASPARLLPQTYRGISLESKDIKNFELQGAFIDKVNQRDSTNYENIKISAVNGRFKSAETNGLYYAGGYYNVSPALRLGLFYLDVNNLYDQMTTGFLYKWDINPQTRLSSYLHYYRSRDEGQAKAGLVDNDLYHAHFELKRQNHKFIFGTFQHFGETAFPYLTGGETGLLIDTWPGEFLNPKEKAYSFRYEYDFKDYVPGLRFMTRYTMGRNIYGPNLGGTDLKERETDFDIGYTVQTGWLKNLSLRARYAIYDNNMLATANIKPVNETRINIDYTWKFK